MNKTVNVIKNFTVTGSNSSYEAVVYVELKNTDGFLINPLQQHITGRIGLDHTSQILRSYQSSLEKQANTLNLNPNMKIEYENILILFDPKNITATTNIISSIEKKLNESETIVIGLKKGVTSTKNMSLIEGKIRKTTMRSKALSDDLPFSTDYTIIKPISKVGKNNVTNETDIFNNKSSESNEKPTSTLSKESIKQDSALNNLNSSNEMSSIDSSIINLTEDLPTTNTIEYEKIKPKLVIKKKLSSLSLTTSSILQTASIHFNETITSSEKPASTKNHIFTKAVILKSEKNASLENEQKINSFMNESKLVINEMPDSSVTPIEKTNLPESIQIQKSISNEDISVKNDLLNSSEIKSLKEKEKERITVTASIVNFTETEILKSKPVSNMETSNLIKTDKIEFFGENEKKNKLIEISGSSSLFVSISNNETTATTKLPSQSIESFNQFYLTDESSTTQLWSTQSSTTESLPTESSTTLSSIPQSSTIELSTTELSATKLSINESSTTETSSTESSTTQTSSTESLPTESSTTELSTTESSITESLPTESLPTESSTTLSSIPQSSTIELSTTELSATKLSINESSTTETSSTESSTTQTSSTESLPTESSTTESSTTESSAIDSSITHSSTIQSSTTQSLPTESLPNESSTTLSSIPQSSIIELSTTTLSDTRSTIAESLPTESSTTK